MVPTIRNFQHVSCGIVLFFFDTSVALGWARVLSGRAGPQHLLPLVAALDPRTGCGAGERGKEGQRCNMRRKVALSDFRSYNLR